MITPFEVYIVMQADDVKNALEGLAGLSLLTAGCLVVFSSLAEEALVVPKKSTALLIFGILCGVTSSLVPSTKTAAAMLVVPAIVNNERLQKEASELYQIAKKALKEAVE